MKKVFLFKGKNHLYIQCQTHGDSTSNVGFQRTKPSIVEMIKEQLKHQRLFKSTKMPQCKMLVHKSAINDSAEILSINKQKRIGHDEIINLHLMHVALDFPNQCMTFPELRVISFDSELVTQAVKLLKAHKKLINFQYDTTFCLTGYYVSTLSFVHPMLLNSKGVHPAILLGYFYHEKKTGESHDDFWRLFYIYFNLVLI